MFGRKKIVYVLGSGAAFGIAHVGVLQFLEAMRIKPSAIVGSSMGAFLGCMYAAGLSSKEIAAIVERFNAPKIANLFMPSFPHGGIVSTDRIREFLFHVVGDRNIECLPIPFVCVATDIITGEEVIFNKGPLLDAVIASLSMPGIFAPCRFAGRQLVDGGLTNPLPMDIARKLGNFSIAVNVLPRVHPAEKRMNATERLAVLKEPVEKTPKAMPPFPNIMSALTAMQHTGTAKGIPGSMAARMVKNIEDRSPGIFDVISNMVWIFSRELIRERRSWGRYLLIEPDVRGFNMFDFTKGTAIIHRGYDAAKEFAPRLARLASRWKI
ncbi:MAG: patatin-like phospholipase family protein [Spirochaetes bacterium]|nr:patatin-like phospholipase family protein [Spirochaetota bacterium]